LTDDWIAKLNPGVPNPARMYDYFLGGKDNFPADREAAEQAIAVSPPTLDMARENRAFLRRAVRFLAAEAGIRRFLDIGAGLPTQGNVHEVAQAVAPDARVVYADIDPVVVTHARALLADPNTAAIQADLRDPDAILATPEVRGLLDGGQPVAILLLAILHFVQDADDPARSVARLRDAVPAGSYLAITHATAEAPNPKPEVAARVVDVYQRATASLALRTGAEVARFFDGFDLVDPGLVQVQEWRPDAPSKAPGGIWGGVGRKR
jgi:hypothetical protein